MRGQSSRSSRDKRPIGEQTAAGLTGRAVIGLVRGIDDALHRRSTVGAGLPVAAVNRHAFVKGGHLLGELAAGFVLQVGDPFRQRGARGIEQTPHLLVA